MFGWALASAAFGGWLVWQWVTNQPNPRTLPSGYRQYPGAVRPPQAPSPHLPRIAPSPELRAKLNECGATDADLNEANAWSAQYLGPQFSLNARLRMMLGMIPFNAWPPSAQRVMCAFR